MHKLWWKHIYWINSTMPIKKVMWLCVNLTNQRRADRSRLQHLYVVLVLAKFPPLALVNHGLLIILIHLIGSMTLLFGSFWKAWAKSVIIKHFCIIVLHDYVPKQLASTAEHSDSIYCSLTACSEAQVIYHIWKWLYSVASPTFLSDI